ncbi:MAG: hypothetical protein L6Q84_23575 [Polyangiaceae bacterium]|nr:hypothetical protein [Polyangiaceae bacterium]
MTDARVALVDLADELQLHKQTIFKLVTKLNIATIKVREPERRNQLIATVSDADAALIRAEGARIRASSDAGVDESGALVDDAGVFYLIQLEPQHDPGRFKVGYSVELEGRLQKHRCSAPFATVVKTWPCKRTWERAAIDCATAGCEQLHTEVFRSASLDDVAKRADGFFAVMPSLGNVATDDTGEAD